MPGKYQYDVEIKTNVAKLLVNMKEVQDRLDTVEGKEYKIKLNIDEKKLSNVISNLEKMLNSLGKGSGDFKQFENVSRELSSIVLEVQNLSKAFGKVDDSGTRSLLSSLQSIDKSLSDLSQHIFNVNKNVNQNSKEAVAQVEEINTVSKKATKSIESLADAMANGRERSEAFRKAEEKRQQLSQNNAINKALDQEYQKRQKLLEATDKQNQKNKQLALSYTASASEKLSSAISKYSYGDSSEATAMMKQMNRGLVNFGDLSNIEGNIKSFSSTIDNIISNLKHSHETSLSLLNDEIKAEETKQKQKDAFNKSNLSAIDLEIQKREEEAKAFSNSLKMQMQSKENFISSLSSTIKNAENDVAKYKAKQKQEGYIPSANFITAFDEYKLHLSGLVNLSNSLSEQVFVTPEQIEKFDNLSQKIENSKIALQSMSSAAKGSTDTSRYKLMNRIGDYMNRNTAMSKEFRKELEVLYSELKQGDNTVNFGNIITQFEKIKGKIREAGQEGKRFWDVVKERAWSGAAQIVGTYLGIHDLIRSGKEGINVVRELNSALTEMRKVSNETEQTLRKYQKTTFDTADTIGTTAKQVQNSTADWQRLGYGLSEGAELAKNSNIYKNVGDMEIDEATEHMISSVQAWKSEFGGAVETSEAIMNRYNKIGNEFAISSADIGEAMERSAAALKAGGNNLNESLGIITAGNVIQQDASVTASAMKILSLRIRGAKADLEEMGESTDNLVDSTSKMREELKALTGVDIMIDENTFKSTAQIIKEIGANWSKMTDVSQAATLEKIAGKNRASTVAGLIENYQIIDEVINAAENADNSALEENEKYLDSMDGKLQQLTNRSQEFWATIIDDKVLMNGIDLLTTLISDITKFIDKFGTFPTLMGAVGAALSFKNVGRDKMYSLNFEYADNIHNLLWIQRFRVCYS